MTEKTYFLNPQEGKYGQYYTNKDAKNRKGAPVVTVFPTRNPKCVKLIVGEADAVLVNVSKNNPNMFFSRDYSQDETVFISKGESQHGEYMRVSIVPTEGAGESKPKYSKGGQAPKSYGAKWKK